MRRFSAPSRRFGIIVGLIAVASSAIYGFLGTNALAGIGGFGNNAVGGIMVDASGLVRSATLDERNQYLNRLRTEIANPQGEMAETSQLRMVSLKKLQAAMQRELETGESLPVEMELLAGLQRVEYVFVYPEQNDIVLAGPAEPWVVREDATIVGANSGRPLLRLSDLLVAMQGVEPSRNGGISVSIEPTAEGRQRLQKVLSRVQLQPGQNPAHLESVMQEAFGPQLVKLQNVPENSHFARVLLSADYQMKRLAMALDTAPVANFPSYLELARNDNHRANENPRWWMACDYDSLTHDQDRLAWKINGQGVKTMTEQDLVDNQGGSEKTGRTSQNAEKWANLMTEHFDALSTKNSIFGELRNIMDLSVVATLIVQEGLDQRANCDLSVLMGKSVQVPTASYEVPKAVSPHCSFIRSRSGWVVTASGGVEITPFHVVENQKLDAALAGTRQQAVATESETWWWNG